MTAAVGKATRLLEGCCEERLELDRTALGLELHLELIAVSLSSYLLRNMAERKHGSLELVRFPGTPGIGNWFSNSPAAKASNKAHGTNPIIPRIWTFLWGRMRRRNSLILSVEAFSLVTTF